MLTFQRESVLKKTNSYTVESLRIYTSIATPIDIHRSNDQ